MEDTGCWINPFCSLAYDSIPTFYFTLPYSTAQNTFPNTLCAILKWTYDCGLSVDLWQPSLSFGQTENLERALDAVSFPFRGRICQFSGHVFLFHYSLFFLPGFFFFSSSWCTDFFLINMLCLPWFAPFNDHSLSGHKYGHNSCKGLRSVTWLRKGECETWICSLFFGVTLLPWSL